MYVDPARPSSFRILRVDGRRSIKVPDRLPRFAHAAPRAGMGPMCQMDRQRPDVGHVRNGG